MQTVLTRQLQSDHNFGADCAYIASLICSGLNLGATPTLPADLAQDAVVTIRIPADPLIQQKDKN